MRKKVTGRNLKVRVKSARGRSVSSARWLERQLNDPYVVQARAQGYRSRAAFKLIEVDEKYKILRPGMKAVDLGAAPGGWTQVLVKKLGHGNVVGIDLQEIDPIDGALLIQGDFMDDDVLSQLKDAINIPVDAVLSDMAASACGHTQTDHLRIMGLAEAAFAFAEEVLAEGGIFVAKVLRGGTERELLDSLKKRFRKVVHFKPPSSRQDSAEMFVIAIGFKAL